MAGSWEKLGGGTYRRFNQTSSGGIHAGGSWQTVSGLDAVRNGLALPDAARMKNDQEYRRQAIEALGQAGNGVQYTGSGFTGGGIGGAGYGSGAMDPVAQSIKDAIDKANAANEARYAEGKGIHDTRLANAENYGAQQKRDADQAFNSRWGGVQQSLIGRGLGSSSLLASGAMGVERERADAQARIGEGVSRYKNDLLADKEMMIRSKSENAPSWGDYLSLMSKAGYGANGGGGGFSGSSYGSAGGGSQSDRPRPWSPNWNMSQGMNPDDAIAKASGNGGLSSLYGGYAPTQSGATPATYMSQGQAAAQRQQKRNIMYGAPSAQTSFWNKAMNAGYSGNRLAR
jgi:hypothetical protein